MSKLQKFPLFSYEWGPGVLAFRNVVGEMIRWVVMVLRPNLKLEGSSLMRGSDIHQLERAIIVERYTRVDRKAFEMAMAIGEGLYRHLDGLRRFLVDQIKRKVSDPATPETVKRVLADIYGSLERREVFVVAVHLLGDRACVHGADNLIVSNKPLTPGGVCFPLSASLVSVSEPNASGAGLVLPKLVYRGFVPSFQPFIPNEEEHPIVVGVSPDGVPVTIKLGRQDQARHFAVLGATGSGKSVCATWIAHQAIGRGIKVLAVDTKGEMVRVEQDGKVRTLFNMEVINPLGLEKSLLWSYSSGALLVDEIRNRFGLENGGGAQMDYATWRKVVESASERIVVDCHLLAELVNQIILGRQRVDASLLSKEIMDTLLQNERVFSAVRKITEDGKASPLFFGNLLTRIMESHLRRRLPEEEADAVIGETSAYRRLIAPLPGQGIVSFEKHGTILNLGAMSMMVGKRSEEAVGAMYTYLINFFLQYIAHTQKRAFRSGKPDRWLLYAEEAHRLPRDMLEAMTRIMRAFGVSLMIVSQHKREILGSPQEPDTRILDQLTAGVIHMNPSPRDAEDVLNAMGGKGIPVPPHLIPNSPYGEFLLFTKSGGRPNFPVRGRVDARKVMQEIVEVRGKQETVEVGI